MVNFRHSLAGKVFTDGFVSFSGELTSDTIQGFSIS
jgi:hypothetical protein